MVKCAPDAHRVLLAHSQTGNGFPGIQKRSVGVADQIHVTTGFGSSAGEGLKKIEHRPLSRQDTAGFA